ncbi:hypothetical protein POTOM_005476 [Populus tomentosa]|uniref:Uncharacterized protein n=1 Tax=Populus tomentosa TaxID=118781 RepID=A0A8X8DFT8_POPTO|nr:hypothetical protein POTOM_005476 [Populus tomentosa]
MAEEDVYTKDGTVDYRGNPANKKDTGTWRACPYIRGNEFCERLAYYGMSSNLILFFKHRLNQQSATATRNNLNWGGTCYHTPLIGAFFADAYLGRYWTIACFSTIYVMIRLMMLMRLRKNTSSFFNWFYFSINVGALIAGSVLVWVLDNVRWGWGFGIPAIAMAIAVASFFSGTQLFRYQKPGGSPLTRICQVLVASFRKKKVEVPADKALFYETADAESNIKRSRKLDHTEELSFLDKAAVETEKDDIEGAVDPWILCTVTQVEELKSNIRLLPIWATGIIFTAVFQILSASLSIFDTLSVIVWVPVYDRIIVPVARKYTGHKNGLTQLQRMGIGLFVSIFSMVSAAILELKRLEMVRRHNSYELKTVPLSIFWQAPQYFLIGCAEVFTFIGQLEFFYEQAPDAMRSMCSALSLTTVALGSYLSSLLVTIVTSISAKNGKPGWIPENLNHGHIDYFFWPLGVLSVLNLCVFLLISNWYTYKKPVGTLR